MRIWDIEPKYLCHKHLLAEHRELHGLWNILSKHKCQGGYSKHPETLRWVGKTKALFARHDLLVKEFLYRGYFHKSPLEKKQAKGKDRQDCLLNTKKEQKEILKNKKCSCFVNFKRKKKV